MIYRFALKVLLMGGGAVGGAICLPKFLRECINIQKCYNDDIGALVGYLFEDYESTAVKFGILIGVFIFSFLLGYCISPEND